MIKTIIELKNTGGWDPIDVWVSACCEEFSDDIEFLPKIMTGARYDEEKCCFSYIEADRSCNHDDVYLEPIFTSMIFLFLENNTKEFEIYGKCGEAEDTLFIASLKNDLLTLSKDKKGTIEKTSFQLKDGKFSDDNDSDDCATFF